MVVIACVLAVFGAGYLLGTNRSQTRELVGAWQVGDRVASVGVDGVWYGVRDSVAWIDAEGSMHEGGWPDCLGSVPATGRVVRFGAMDVTYPDGASGPAVVYVDCRS